MPPNPHPGSGKQVPAPPSTLVHLQEDGPGRQKGSNPLQTRLTPVVFQVAELPAKEDAESRRTLLLLPERSHSFTPGASIWRPRRRRAAGARRARSTRCRPPIPAVRGAAPSRCLFRPLPADGLSRGQWDGAALLPPINILCLQLGQVRPGVREGEIFSWPQASPPLLQLPASPAGLLPSAWGWGSAGVGTGRMDRAENALLHLERLGGIFARCAQAPQAGGLLSTWLRGPFGASRLTEGNCAWARRDPARRQC